MRHLTLVAAHSGPDFVRFRSVVANRIAMRLHYGGDHLSQHERHRRPSEPTCLTESQKTDLRLVSPAHGPASLVP